LTVTQQLPLNGQKAEPTVQVLTDSTTLPTGVYDIDYYHGRQKKRQLMYRLRRRTDEVEQALRRYGEAPLRTILDVGTADGLMLAALKQKLNGATFLGIDYSLKLLQAAPVNGALKMQADALSLPFRAKLADAVIATAVIEHVADPARLVQECARVLRPHGLLILTTPDPLMDRVATAIGLLKDSGHQETFNLKKLRALCQENGFDVVEARKFMFSPIGFPAEKTIERLLGPFGLTLVMANQLLVAKRTQ
jgi:SAM-dependent methyltransferase